jgi:hypothetical protein
MAQEAAPGLVQTTEFFNIVYTAGATIVARFMRLSDQFILDDDDNTFKADADACTDPDHNATENADLGDGTESFYLVSVARTVFEPSLKPSQHVVQFRDGDGNILATEDFWVQSGQRILPPNGRL